MAKNFFTDILFSERIYEDHRTDNQFTEELKSLKKVFHKSTPIFEVNFKKPLTSKRKYYHKKITNETNFVFNKFITDFNIDTIEDEYFYLYKKHYRYLSQTLRNINSNVNSRNLSVDYYSSSSNHSKSDEAYIIFFLKSNVIMLLMELQERYGKYSQDELLTLEEIYEVYFNEELPSDIIITKQSTQKPKEIIETPKGNINKKKSFGYKYTNTQKLLTVLKLLQLKIDLIDETVSTIEKLLELLLSPNFIKPDIKIKLLCETTQFRYIVDKLKPHFNNLTPTSIEESGKFYTKNNVLLKKSNLYKNKVHNPKEKEEIDKIFNQL